MFRGRGSGARVGSCTLRSREVPVWWGLGVGVMVAWDPLLDRMTDTNENITFPQLLWRAVKILFVIFTGCNEVLAKVMFLLEFVILFTGRGGLPQCMLGYSPPPGTPPPPPGADPGIWSMSGRYASYWNAFLYDTYFLFVIWLSLTSHFDISAKCDRISLDWRPIFSPWDLILYRKCPSRYKLN